MGSDEKASKVRRIQGGRLAKFNCGRAGTVELAMLEREEAWKKIMLRESEK